MSTSPRTPRRTVRYLALIYLAPGQREGLRRYERSVLPVFKRHGGAFERIWTPVVPDAAPDAEAPDEIHLLRFDREDGLEAARRDPEMQALAELRARVVRKAVLVRVADVPLARYFADPA
jgi:uncharacterized protein (DUF1330 family)